MVRTIDGDIIVADDDGEILSDEGDDRVAPDDEGVELLTDGGRPPLSSFDHAPDVGPSDVDKCRECGRYAPHAFDHAPACSRFEPIEAEPDVEPSAANNPRMARPAADGGRIFDDPGQSAEALASAIVAAQADERAAVHVDGGENTLSIYEGDVASTGYKRHGNGTDGTHVVAIDLPDRRVAVSFDRVVDFDRPTNLVDPDPVLFDPKAGERYKVTGFETVDNAEP